jgi:hypothetical protein
MNDVESLLRATLADPRRRLQPEPGHLRRVADQARVLRRRRWRRAGAVALAVVAVVGGGTLAAGRWPGGGATPATRPTPAGAGGPLPPYEQASGLEVGTGRAVAVAALPHGFAVLEPSAGAVLRVDARTLRPSATGTVPATAAGLVADRTGNGRLWVWCTAGGGATVREYDPVTLAPVGPEVPVPARVTAASAAGGDLWVATAAALYRVTGGSAVRQDTRQLPTGIVSLGADPDGRLVGVGAARRDFGSGLTAQLFAYDPHRDHLTLGAALPLDKPTVAVVGRHVWVAGYAGGGVDTLLRLDVDTLSVAGTSPLDRRTGPGAILWPGEFVLWVANGDGSGLSCLNAINGNVIRRWSGLGGPAASVPGVALVVGTNTGAHSATARLELDAQCTG